MACELHPAYAEARAELPYLTTRELITVATGRGPVHERALALWYALGTDRAPSTLAPRRGEPRVVFDQLCEAGWPHSIVEVAREGFRRTREMLCPLVALLAASHVKSTQIENDDLPAEDDDRRRPRLGVRRLYTGGPCSVGAFSRNRCARCPLGAGPCPTGAPSVLPWAYRLPGRGRACRQSNAVATGGRASLPSRLRVLGS